MEKLRKLIIEEVAKVLGKKELKDKEKNYLTKLISYLLEMLGDLKDLEDYQAKNVIKNIVITCAGYIRTVEKRIETYKDKKKIYRNFLNAGKSKPGKKVDISKFTGEKSQLKAFKEIELNRDQLYDCRGDEYEHAARALNLLKFKGSAEIMGSKFMTDWKEYAGLIGNPIKLSHLRRIAKERSKALPKYRTKHREKVIWFGESWHLTREDGALELIKKYTLKEPNEWLQIEIKTRQINKGRAYKEFKKIWDELKNL